MPPLSTVCASAGCLSGPPPEPLSLADPALRWAGAGLYGGGTIAYLSARPVSDDANEFDLVMHGPVSDKLIGQVATLLLARQGHFPNRGSMNAHAANLVERLRTLMPVRVGPIPGRYATRHVSARAEAF